MEKQYVAAASLPADILWRSFVTHSFLPHGRRPLGRNECVTNEPQRTSCGEAMAAAGIGEGKRTP